MLLELTSSPPFLSLPSGPWGRGRGRALERERERGRGRLRRQRSTGTVLEKARTWTSAKQNVNLFLSSSQQSQHKIEIKFLCAKNIRNIFLSIFLFLRRRSAHTYPRPTVFEVHTNKVKLIYVKFEAFLTWKVIFKSNQKVLRQTLAIFLQNNRNFTSKRVQLPSQN